MLASDRFVAGHILIDDEQVRFLPGIWREDRFEPGIAALPELGFVGGPGVAVVLPSARTSAMRLGRRCSVVAQISSPKVLRVIGSISAAASSISPSQ